VRRRTVIAVAARLVVVIVVIVGVIAVAAILVTLIVPVKHALALLEVVCYVVDAVLPGVELVFAEPAVAWKLGLGTHDTRLLVLIAIHFRVDVPEMLHEMVLPEAGPYILNTIADAQAAHP
jgi:hypothetical protein